MHARGFSLIEIIVVTGLFVVLVGLGIAMGMETFQGTLFRSEREMVVSLLQKARSRALANTYQSAWGMCMIDDAYIIFRGTACVEGTATNERIPKGSRSAVTFSAPIVFAPVTGTTAGGTVTVTEDARTTTLDINHEGTINW